MENGVFKLFYEVFPKEQNMQIETYNIFDVLEVSDKEVIMCRMLADLLDPMGRHGCGTRFLRLFWTKVLGMEELSETEYVKMMVYREYVITENRRIDIVIENRDVFIPIEVKIDAMDQPSQCYDYYQFAKKKDKDTYVVYITKNGKYPSELSMYSKNQKSFIGIDRIKPVSFIEDIVNWLERLLADTDEKISMMLQQYIEAIRKMENRIDKEEIMGFADKILTKEENLRASLHIADSINDIKARVLYLLMQEFDIQMEKILEKYHLEKETKFNELIYEEQANASYYEKSEVTYPGINYVVKDISLEDDLQLWFRIEVDWSLFAGLCVFDTKKKGSRVNKIVKNQSVMEKLGECIDMVPNPAEWWYTWRFLPTGVNHLGSHKEVVPNFKPMNEAAIKLAEKEKREVFVKECIAVIENSILAHIKCQ